jgi:hypothetical protein
MAQRKRTGSTLQSGKHANPRRLVTATPQQWAKWDAQARRLGCSWATLTASYWDSISPTVDEPKKDPHDT